MSKKVHTITDAKKPSKEHRKQIDDDRKRQHAKDKTTTKGAWL